MTLLWLSVAQGTLGEVRSRLCVLRPLVCLAADAMAARLCCTPDRGQRRRIAELEPTAQQTPAKQHEDKDSHGRQTPAASPGELAQRPVSGAVREYRPRGTCGTFAGRRPPKDVAKLRKFNEDRAKHLENLCKEKGKKRRSTSMMATYRGFVQKMLPLETEGSGAERLCSVAAKWKQRATTQDHLARENRMVL